MRHPLKWALLAAATLTSVTCATKTQAQSVDALLDKLVDKGVLTSKEANELKEEADQGFTKAYQVKSGLPDWVTAFKINGDFRGRVEGVNFENENFTDRLRYRYRLRLGAVAVIKDNLEVGLRLTSSDTAGGFTSGDPISGNTTLQDNGSKKFVFIDLAYGRWTPINSGGFADTITVGKMENPFVFSDMVFDHDYTPEGIANTFAYNLNSQHAVKLNLGAFVLDEIAASAKDPYLLGAQLRWDGNWSPKFQTTLGVGALTINNSQNLGNAAVPNINAGNSRDPAGTLSHHLNPIVGDGAVTYSLTSFPYYSGPFPIKLYGEYMNNPAAPDQNSAWMGGIAFGKSGKRGTWAIDYRYKYLERDSWYEEFTDSDYGALHPSAGTLGNSGKTPGYSAGTNIKGHVIRASYSPFDAMTLQITYFLTELVQGAGGGSSDTGRFQVDAVWKF